MAPFLFSPKQRPTALSYPGAHVGAPLRCQGNQARFSSRHNRKRDAWPSPQNWRLIRRLPPSPRYKRRQQQPFYAVHCTVMCRGEPMCSPCHGILSRRSFRRKRWNLICGRHIGRPTRLEKPANLSSEPKNYEFPKERKVWRKSLKIGSHADSLCFWSKSTTSLSRCMG